MGLEKWQSNQYHADTLVSNHPARISRGCTIKHPTPSGTAGRKLTASWIAVTLIVAALIGVYFHSFSDQEVSETGPVEARRVVELNLKLEAASASQTLGQRETTAVLMQDTDASQQAPSASTVQHPQVLEEETSRNDAKPGS